MEDIRLEWEIAYIINRAGVIYFLRQEMQEQTRPHDDLYGLILRVPASRGPLAHRQIAPRRGFSRILYIILYAYGRNGQITTLGRSAYILYNIINTMDLIKSHDSYKNFSFLFFLIPLARTVIRS